MASLKEIKSRIASVSSTLKITSAMKLVASAKLRKAQQAIGNMLPYERQLHRILVDILSSDMEVSDRRPENGIMVARSVKGWRSWHFPRIPPYAEHSTPM